MLWHLQRHTRLLESDPTVSVLILTGVGCRAFCSGNDIAAAASVLKGHVRDPLSDPVCQLHACSKAVLAAINGYAVAAGFEAMSSRLSFGMTPKTVRLPKNGEMLLSVRGSPLGVYKEEDLASISTVHESVDGSPSAGSQL